MNIDLEIQVWPIENITPYKRNPRTIPARAIEKVALSIRENKWRQPIVVDAAGVIIVGHVRYLAAQKLGLDRVPVHVAKDMTPEQVRAYRIMDNRCHEETGWELDLLTLEMAELKVLDVDVTVQRCRCIACNLEPDELRRVVRAVGFA
jgi:ParB-like chromosome segregation protein Spo0J